MSELYARQRILAGLASPIEAETFIRRLEAEIAQLRERAETAERERDEAAQHSQEVGQFWHDAETRAEAAKALNAELRAALEKLIWSGVGWSENTCIECYSYPDAGHEPECSLGAILARTPEAALVRLIREWYDSGIMDIPRLAVHFGVTIGTIHSAIHRKTWKYA